MRILLLPLYYLLGVGFGLSLMAQAPSPTNISLEQANFEALHWRGIGPFRGGRSAAVTGVPGQPNLFYFGATGGGVWRTQDGGQTWANISDGYFGGSIGAVAVSEWDNNVIYVGGGEVTVRGNVSSGNGIWKSEDAGKTWQYKGLPTSRHIPRMRVHPRNADLVYAAVMGDLYKSSADRGVYRSKDGGDSWEKILFVNEDAGAVDLILDPLNPRVIYASTWRIRRTPYSLESGGEGSGLWKSTDGGDTWTELSQKKGMPQGTLGIIGIAVSPVKRDRVWAIVEAAKGGVFRSEDGGETWMQVNTERALRQRAWYYSRIYADTEDEDGVYVVNVDYHKSTDGGKTFEALRAPHGDHHDLWIAPEDPKRMIMGDDGGAQVSFDGGENWSTYQNQPTAQFYRVTTDNHFPYRIYGAQQDNSTIRIAHRTDGYGIGSQDWEPSAGGESAHMAVDPENNDIVYGGSYGGYLTRVNHDNGQDRAINVWPDNPMGYGAEGMKYRFQWNFPIFFSPHNSKKLYACSNHLHVTTNEGQSWEIISPDLTRNDSAKLISSGGPITKDNTGVEYYATIFAAAESQHEAGVIWAGSDDGLLHITKDGGKNWTNVTPPSLPEWSMINSLEIDPHDAGGCYFAATLYKTGDYQPLLYKTTDYGKSWTKIVDGIEAEHFTRVVRADPVRKGLLFAGTEQGMYVSFDDGGKWEKFQLNLPMVPITDLTIKEHNLIAATQGRSMWMIDDLGPVREWNREIASKPMHLFKPLDTYRLGGGTPRKPSLTQGENHPGGVLIHFYMPELPADSVETKLVVMESDGTPIQSYSSKAKDKSKQLKAEVGLNRFAWNLRYPDPKKFDGMIVWASMSRGPKAIPGTYKVRLVVGSDSMEQEFKLLSDPRMEGTQADLVAQFEFLQQVSDKLSETHQAITDIRQTRKELDQFKQKVGDQKAYTELKEMADKIDEKMTEVEKALYQTKNRSRQDPLNFPIRLNNKLGHVGALASRGDYRPTDQDHTFLKEVSGKIDEQLAKWESIQQKDIPAFNSAARQTQLDILSVKVEEQGR